MSSGYNREVARISRHFKYRDIVPVQRGVFVSEDAPLCGNLLTDKKIKLTNKNPTKNKRILLGGGEIRSLSLVP